MNGELRHVRSIQGMYRPPYLTCYGNLHWRSKQKLLRPDSKPRFLEYLNKEEEDPFRKWQLDYVHRLRNQRRQEKKSRGGSAAGLHITFGASLEIRDEVKSQFGETETLNNPKKRKPAQTGSSDGKSTSQLRANQAIYAARQNEMIYEVASNGDFLLNFDEFKHMVNQRLRIDKPDSVLHERKLRKWFDALDADGNGEIDPSEFFAFALREAIIRSDLEVGDDEPGTAFSAMFQQGLSGVKEKERMGKEQFCALTAKLGFGAVGETIFEKFLEYSGNDDDDDPSNDGTINVRELLTIVHSRTADLRPLLVGWAKHTTNENVRERYKAAERKARFKEDKRRQRMEALNAGVKPLDTNMNNQLDLDEVTVKALLHMLREFLEVNQMDAQAFFRALDLKGTWRISESEMRKGLAQLGFASSRELAEILFDELDTDADYRLSFTEIHAWIRERDHAWDTSKARHEVMSKFQVREEAEQEQQPAQGSADMPLAQCTLQMSANPESLHMQVRISKPD